MADINNDPLIGDDNFLNTGKTFDDASASFPPVDYWNRSSLNKGYYGGEGHRLALTGLSGDNVDIAKPAVDTEYTKTDINVTQSGHVIEYNDTPGGERILIKHRTGAGVDILPDGSVAISARGRHVMTILDDMTIVVNGNAKYEFKGNLDFNVKGDFTINASNMNVNVTGNLTEAINGAMRTNITGNKGEVVLGNSSVSNMGTYTNTTLGDINNIAKGKMSNISGSNMEMIGGSVTKISAQSSFNLASPNVYLAGSSVSLVGASGTMGGQGVVVYGKGATFEEGVTAPTFFGALEGNAKTATQAGRAGTAGLGPGGSGGAEINVPTPTTAKPTASNMNEYLNVSSKGTQKVNIREEDIRNVYNKTDETGGLSVTDPTTGVVRSKLRDPANKNNTKFIASQVARGTLSPTYAQTSAPNIERIVPQTPVTLRGQTPIGNQTTKSNFNNFKPAPIPVRKSFTPDLEYIIED